MAGCFEGQNEARRFQRQTTTDSERVHRACATDESVRPTPKKRRTTPVNLLDSARGTAPAIRRSPDRHQSVGHKVAGEGSRDCEARLSDGFDSKATSHLQNR